MGVMKAKKLVSKLGSVSKKVGAVAKTIEKKPQKVGAVAKTIEKKPRKERQAYVVQPASMSKEKWVKLQVGMKEKWPQPTYMAEPNPRGGHTCYRDETYMVILRWTKDTKIEYRPHAKAPGSKSHIRYESYSKAKTVGEALALKSIPQDWCWDYERGHIKVLGGRQRDEPIDPSVTDIHSLDEVDTIISKWFIREAAHMLGMSLKQLSEDNSARDALILRMRRTLADTKGKEILAECAAQKRKVCDADVLAVLQKWGFKKNDGRINVMQEGVTFVFSDTVGLVSDRKGCIAPTAWTLAYPNAMQVLCTYLQNNLPSDLKGFSFTSININKNYAGKLHRDGNNVGPSVIKAFGAFTGGLLNYYPNDDRTHTEVTDLPKSDLTKADLSKNLALFDGKRGHAVDPFEGERFTLVYFTAPRNDRCTPENRAGMTKCGFAMTTAKSAKELQTFLAPPRGYAADRPKTAKGPQLRTWAPVTPAPSSSVVKVVVESKAEKGAKRARK